MRTTIISINTIIKAYILLCLLFVYSNCTNNKHGKSGISIGKNEITNNYDSSSANNILNICKNVEYFYCKKKLTNGDYNLEIETTYKNDTLVDDIPLRLAFPIIICQKLIFKKNDDVIKIVDLPFKKINKLTKSGKYVKMAEMSIWLIYSIKARDKTILFGISGTSFCFVGDCPEYDAFFSENGEMLSQCNYLGENKWESPCTNNEILKKYGITNDKLRLYQKEGILVDIWTSAHRSVQ